MTTKRHGVFSRWQNVSKYAVTDGCDRHSLGYRCENELLFRGTFLPRDATQSAVMPQYIVCLCPSVRLKRLGTMIL